MNLKKTLAGLSAGVVAVASMATVAASAQEAGSKEFNTYDVMYQGVATVTITAAVKTENTAVKFTDNSVLSGDWNIDDAKIIKLKRDGDTYTEEDEIDTFSGVDGTGITLEGVGLAVGKVITATIEIKTDKDDNKDDVKDIVEAADDAEDVFTSANCDNFKVGKVSAKAVSERVYLQIGGKRDGANIDNEAWVSLTRGGASIADCDDGNLSYDMDAAAPEMPQPELEGIGTEIANTLAANRGAKLVFYFEDKMEAEDDGLESGNSWSQDTGWSDGETEDFAIRVNGTKALTGIGLVDKDALTISFDWDTVLAKSNLVNAVGQVSMIEFKANEEGFLYSGDYDDDKDEATYRYQITKIVVEWPASDAVAEDMSDLAAGEAETTVEAALPGADAAATTVAAATDAAANPSTGNSAVALAVIPVAIAAAAFVAKKRG